ncbi:MAG TPA: 50S ribosomal protein L11 methyltransferase [Peptococcaceae bacterium]|nr:MAG: Ribosomal protein L11 methyltransferase [Clostridia bacterium 41_269]HBT20314.1 50S ribosomal protein L11 methyltransferase [Peptococcaceae bacterium]
MKWQEIKLTTSKEAAEAAANIFFEIGVQGVVIEDEDSFSSYNGSGTLCGGDDQLEPQNLLIPSDFVVIKGYLPVDEHLGKRMNVFYEKIKGLKTYFPDCYRDLEMEEIDEEDWSSSWKKFFKTQKIGKKIVIKPRWEDYEAEKGEIVVEVDPGTAFGTGTHPTTIACLEMIEKYLRKGQIVFDVGCGSGILSIAAAKLGAYFVYARDVDPVAVKVARKNFAYNKVQDLVEAKEGNYLDGIKGRAHMVVANIIADSIIEFSPQAYEKLLFGGIFISSGIINRKSEEVRRRIEQSGFEIMEVRISGEWATIAARKPKD